MFKCILHYLLKGYNKGDEQPKKNKKKDIPYRRIIFGEILMTSLLNIVVIMC